MKKQKQRKAKQLYIDQLNLEYSNGRAQANNKDEYDESVLKVKFSYEDNSDSEDESRRDKFRKQKHSNSNVSIDLAEINVIISCKIICF